MNQEIEFVLWREQQQTLLEFCLREADLAASEPQPDPDGRCVLSWIQRLVHWARLAEPRVGVLNLSGFED